MCIYKVKLKPPVVPPLGVTPLLPPQPTEVLKWLFWGAQLRDLQNKRQMPLQRLGPGVLHIDAFHMHICIYICCMHTALVQYPWLGRCA